MLTLSATACLAIVWVGVSWAFVRRRKPERGWARAATLVLPGMALCLLAEIVSRIAPGADGFGSFWNDARLLPAASLVRGLPVYPAPFEDAIAGNIYGPVHAFAYVFAGVLPHPTACVSVGVLLSVLLYAAPLAVAVWSSPDRVGRWPLFLGALSLFGFLTVGNRALSFAAFTINADVVAVGLGGVACVALARGLEARSERWMWTAAIGASLAVWGKQTAAPLLAALPFWCLFRNGPRAAGGFLVKGATALCGFSLVMLGLFDAESLLFHMFVFPAGHPWHESLGVLSRGGDKGALLVLFEALLLFLGHAVGIGAAWGGGALLGAARFRVSGIRTPLLRSDASVGLLVFCGLLMIPMALIGRSKAGGDINAFAHPLYYLGLAFSLGLCGFLRACLTQGEGAWRPTRLATSAAVLGVAVWLAFSSARCGRGWGGEPDPRGMEFEYVRKHPGEAYFSWSPLVHVMGEGRLRHFAYGIFERTRFGPPLGDGQFQAGLPADMKRIAFSDHAPRFVMMEMFPEYTNRVAVPDLPGWVVYERSGKGKD